LSPAYDHARSLGVTLTEERRARHIRENSVEAWALRGTAHRFQVEPGAPTPTLVDLAARALALAGAAARNHWRSQVEALEVGVWSEVLERVPELSEGWRTFVSQLLSVNRRRILDEC
jgi:hypothetical protein